MDRSTLRAWWAHRSGLDGTLEGAAPEKVLARCGWSRSVGGVGPYLTLFARAGTSRVAADAAVRALAIHELPVARGCTYVVPSDDFAIGLTIGRSFGESDMKQALKLGVTEEEIVALCEAVVKALAAAKGPMNPEEIRGATGPVSRGLGAEGRKKGLTTTLPLALGRLQSGGTIRRVPVNGRLDQQRYAYTLWSPHPLAKYAGSVDDALQAVARRFFTWVGPATAAEFQWFSGLGVRASAAVLASLALEPMEPGSERLLLPEDVEAFRTFKAPAAPRYVLVSSLDPITANRRDIASFVDPRDAEREVMGEKALTRLGGLADLPSHAILDRGRLVGLWEYDTERAAIAWMAFGARDKALEAAVKRTEMFVRDELGDARSFSLDSAKSRAPRVRVLWGE